MIDTLNIIDEFVDMQQELFYKNLDNAATFDEFSGRKKVRAYSSSVSFYGIILSNTHPMKQFNSTINDKYTYQVLTKEDIDLNSLITYQGKDYKIQDKANYIDHANHFIYNIV